MPFWESSKEKEFRELVEGKMEICLTKPDKYQQAFPVLDSLVRKPNQNAIEMIVAHIKEVIKQDDYEPAQKLRAIILLRDLMESQSKPLGKYVVTKILKRLTILAQHRKSEKDENRGANIFKCKKSQQKYGIQFLKVLLLCLSDWGKNWPRNADGPFHDFQSAYNDLLLQKQVAFPPEEKRVGKSPAPKGFRNSKQEYASPPKVAPPKEKKTMIQNPLTKPTIKQKTLVTGRLAEYMNSMVQLLNLLSTALSQNPQFGEMWPIIKAYVDQFKAIDEQGNLICAQMMDKGQQNEEVLNVIQSNSDFIAELNKNTGIVDRKNQNYGNYNGTYVKKCKKISLILSRYLEKPSSASMTNNNSSARNLKAGVETSLNQKVEQVKPLQKPKTEAQRNRYGSSNQLRNQLQLNLQQVKKQDFNSGTLNKPNQNSEGSGRFNSIPANQAQKNRYSVSQFNSTKEKEKETAQVQNKTDFFEKTEEIQPEKKIVKKQISQISQKNENESSLKQPGSQKDVSKNQKSKTNGVFGQFQIQGQNSNSNSQFFKDLQMKDQGKMQAGRRNRKVQNKNSEEVNNFFNISVKSKIESEQFSGFEKSKQKSGSQEVKEKEKNSSKDNSQLKAFDTFKSPNEIVKTIEEFKKSESQLKEKSFDWKNDNPFLSGLGENATDNKSQRSAGNPFESKLQHFEPGSPNQVNEGNPFETKFEPNFSQFSKKSNDEQDNKSKISNNPFSEKKSISQKSQERSSIKSKPPIPKKKTEQSANPFDAKSQHSQKFDQKEPDNLNVSGRSGISNPFGDVQKIQKKGFDSSKSLSQRGSFVNAKDTGTVSVKNPSNIMEDFFNDLKQVPQKTVEQKLKEGLEDMFKKSVGDKNQINNQGFNFDDFMDVSKRKSDTQSVKNKPNEVQKQLNKSGGLNFSDFDNVRDSQGNQRNSFQSNNFFETSQRKIEPKPSQQSSFDFFKSKEIKPQQGIKKEVSKDFFETSKQESQKQGDKSGEDQRKKNSFDAMQFGFEDFPNVSHTSGKESKNPFSQSEQQSKGTIDPLKLEPNELKPPLNKSGDSWNKLKKQSGESDEWNKFANIAEKESEQSGFKQDQSRYEESQQGEKKETKSDIPPWFDDYNRNQRVDPVKNYNESQINQHEQELKEPRFGNSQKSLSIHFDETSPFQKKEIPWEYTHGALPSSTRYNVRPENINEKKQALILIQSENKSRLAIYGEVNDKLNRLKKEYASCLQKLGQAREQKNQFHTILKRLRESNQIKEREIQDLIKKKIKAEELKTKILEKERLLYERIKGERKSRDLDLANKERVGNKWERFNQNLKKQRESMQLERTASHYSYYA